MKKLFSIFCAILFSTIVFGNDVVFKMTSTCSSTTSVSINGGSTQNISGYYYFYGGGSAYVHSGEVSTGKAIESGIARITNVDSWIQINLRSGYTAQEGDIIKYWSSSYESNKNILLHTKGGNTAGGRTGAVKVNHNQEYTVKSTDVIVGAGTIYINVGQNVASNTNYVQNFSITRPTDLVKYYTFEEMTAENYVNTPTTQYELVAGELYLNSNNSKGSEANSIKSVDSKPKAIYMKGNAENRATILHVTDPCEIRIWGWSEQKKLGFSIGAYDHDAIDTTIFVKNTISNNNEIVNKAYEYTGFEDHQTFYFAPTEGVFYIAAIRVTYPRIRPAANLTVSPAEATLKVGESQVFTYNKDYEDAVVIRSKTEESDESWLAIGTEVENTSVELTAAEAGVGHVYTLKLTQVADAYCRGAEVEVPITIEAAASTPTGVGEVQGEKVQCTKVLRDGQLMIEKGGRTYNAQGIEVKLQKK